MEEEIWKDIQGYEGIYQVSNFGRVKGLERIVPMSDGKKRRIRERILHFDIREGGYKMVHLCYNKTSKHCFVHRLVASAFLHNPLNLPFINHKDENPLNNTVENLEWCTAKYNTNYGSCRKKMSEKAKERNKSSRKPIKQLSPYGEFIKEWDSVYAINRELGFCMQSIRDACKRAEKISDGAICQRATAYGYLWEYK